MKKIGNVLWGIVFIGLGLIIGLNTLGYTEIDIFFDGWWTLFIIVPCLIGLFSEREKTGNLIGIVIGVLLLLACQDILDFDIIWRLAFPAILVIVGISFILKDSIHSKVSKEIKKLNANHKGENEYCATFSSQNVNFDNEEFNGCDLTSVFGGVKCDLRNAKITKDQVINVCAIFGGVEILLPKDSKVKIKSTSIFGGVSNKYENSNNKEIPTIYVNATCVFGGAELK